MKKIFFIIFIVILSQNAFCQNSAEINKISLSVIMPENVDGLDESQLSKLETKISQIVTNSGIGASGYNNSFVIYPKFSIYETNTVEGGMQNLTLVKCELSLFIKQVENNVLFSSTSKMLTGSGKSKLVAMTNAISKIEINDDAFKAFLAKGKEKIINYYDARCIDIISQSESFSLKQDFEQSLALLMTVPQEVSCFSKAQQKSIEIYKAYQNKKCKALIHEVNLSVANNNYDKAIETLGLIDPSSSCHKEADLIIKKIENKIDAEQKRQLDFKMKVYNDQIALEKQRLDAVKEIAIAYYKNRPSVQYNYIIR